MEDMTRPVTQAEFRQEASWVRGEFADVRKRFAELGLRFDALMTEMRKGFALLQEQLRASESRNAERMVAFAAKAEQYERKTLTNDDKFRQARERLDEHELRIRKLESGEPRA